MPQEKSNQNRYKYLILKPEITESNYKKSVKNYATKTYSIKKKNVVIGYLFGFIQKI